MFWQRHLCASTPSSRVGVREMWPQAPGVAAWGLMTGVAMVKSGLALPESLAMGPAGVRRQLQLAAFPLLVAGAPAWVIRATGSA